MHPDIASQLTIRKAARGDHAALVAALGQPEFFADRIGRARHQLGDLLVALVDGAPVGGVYVWCETLEEPELRELYPDAPLLNHLEVVPEWRGNGIGTALLRAGEKAAKARGYDIVVIGVGTDNPRAKALYRRLGYIDWHGGTLIARWTEPDGMGGVRAAELPVDVLVHSLLAPHPDAWDAWHPRELAARLSGRTVPWHVAGGWALDLWRETQGRPQMRPHEDLEFAIPRAMFPEVAPAFGDFSLFVVGAGAIRPIRDGFINPEMHQVWAADMTVPAYRTDIFLEPGDAQTWVCRRQESIRRPMADVVMHTADGVPFLAPECVLLYKAKGNRDKDRADFDTIAPDLPVAARKWLAQALSLAHPGHRWIDELS